MTIPSEKKRALLNTHEFLLSLLDKSKTPRVPMSVRLEARYCLKHYPLKYEIEKLDKLLPEMFCDSSVGLKKKKNLAR